MIDVGLTGGIGSGKSLISKIFFTLGIPIYNSDERAKHLMDHSESIKHEIIKVFGKEAYLGQEKLNRSYVSEIIFKEKNMLEALNQIIHPAVKLDYKEWKENQIGIYNIMESALLFEANIDKSLDKIIIVTASETLRIKRVIQRDKLTEKQVLERIKHQWQDSEKVKHADYVIINDEKHSLTLQIIQIHHSIIFFHYSQV